MTIDTASLHEELQRLNTIVRLLADRNRELESELDRYRS
ncbi:MAG: tol-pal system protein YbgF, partial [Chitinophagaceae bacterium]